MSHRLRAYVFRAYGSAAVVHLVRLYPFRYLIMHLKCTGTLSAASSTPASTASRRAHAPISAGSSLAILRSGSSAEENQECFVFFRYDHMYHLEIVVNNGSKQRREASLEKSVTQWIDEEGQVLLSLISNDLLPLCRSLRDDKKKQ